MTDTVADLVSAVKTEGGFDVDEATVLKWLSRRQRTMVVRGRVRKLLIAIGTGDGVTKEFTVENEPAPAFVSVAEILELKVGGEVWTPGDHSDITAGELGRLRLSGPGGIYAAEHNEGATFTINLYPTPGEGAAIQAWVVGLPLDLEVGQETTLVIPQDFTDALVSGAIATGLLRLEGRPDLAQPLEQIFNEACVEVRRRIAQQADRPRQIRIAGVNA